MAMEKSALLELLEALKAGGVDDRIRLAAQSMYQALIDAEAEGVIGAGFWERSGTGPGSGCCPRRPGIWSYGSPSCGPGRSSRVCWSAGAGSTRRCSR
jgi:hypothetical protein